VVLAVVLLLPAAARAEDVAGRGGLGPLPPSEDERLDLEVDASARYGPVLSGAVPVVPSPGLPPGLEIGQSNNNLSIARHEGRLFLAFRTAPHHFATSKARLVVLSSPDLGRTWAVEASFSTGRDVREPFLLDVGGRLFLYFAELGDRIYAFEPRALWRSSRCGPGCWTPAERWGEPEEVAWDFKVRGGRAWMTSYQGKHYDVVTRPITMRFRSSLDGVRWRDVGDGPVYRGGATESSFEFDRQGVLWAVTRNEDGDATGFGSQVASAAPGAPGAWTFPARSNPLRYDSPRVFRHGDDIYLVARRNVGAAPGERFPSVPGELRKLFIWASYSLQPKRTALYRLDRAARRFEPLLDLPSAGDTAFPSIVRLSAHEFLIANYSSAFHDRDRTWLWGQIHGTGIYFVRLRFERSDSPSGDRPGESADDGAVADGLGPAALHAFGPDWPRRERPSPLLAGFGAASVGAILIVRRRARRLIRAASTPAASRAEGDADAIRR
jgi:hypothetical protein